jgi:hypothetical protein
MQQLIPQDVLVRYLELDSYAPHQRAHEYVTDWVYDYLLYTRDEEWVANNFSAISQELAAARQWVADRLADHEQS